MTAILKPFGILREYIHGASQVSIPSNITVREAITALNIPAEIVALVVVNGAQQSKDYLIQEDDEIKLLAVVGGGA
ncbi:MAG: MoaD/ThiS family protein [Anaerolineales bacterium]